MDCAYCYSPPRERRDMTVETVEESIRFSASMNPVNTGIIFFGGEPLLRKDLIYRAVAVCRELEEQPGVHYHFKVTTNGLLLDAEFLEFAHRERVGIGLSIDGIREAHDYYRRRPDGKGTFDAVESTIGGLLESQPYAYALMTVCPETVQYYADSVAYLINKGFRYIVASLNYAGDWTRPDLEALEKQYKRLAALYEEWTLAGKKFYFSPFEKKLASHIQGKGALCQRCHFGTKQLSIAPDGSIYPCVQFVKNDGSGAAFRMGHVSTGIDPERQRDLVSRAGRDREPCGGCALQDRCEHRCSCLNWQTTGNIENISPVLCETEKIAIRAADQLGAALFKKKAPLFIQKHYNRGYPFISYMEDMHP